ncbi:MAG TPA: hypothetical protein VHU91_08205 [Mycobacteriales bacterium]|nr:hypothetical protein [Mycobacteriales bacterium]
MPLSFGNLPPAAPRVGALAPGQRLPLGAESFPESLEPQPALTVPNSMIMQQSVVRKTVV